MPREVTDRGADRPGKRGPKPLASELDEGRGGRGVLALGGALALVLGGALLYRFLAHDEVNDPAAASASASPAPSDLAPRCVPAGVAGGFVIGEPAKPANGAASAAPGPDVAVEPDRDDLLAPFAVVIGRATASERGFFVGVLGDGDGGTVANLVALDREGAGKVIKLARSRADFDPPVIAVPPTGGPALVALTEPNASARAIRLGSVSEEGKVTWGAEIPEGRDDSMALDLAVDGAKHGVVTWDDTSGERSYVALAGFGSDNLGSLVGSRRATPKELDCDSPRVAVRPDGFYLAYLVHGSEAQRDRVADKGKDDEVPSAASAAPSAAKDEPAPKKKSKKKKADAPKKGADDGEIDESLGGESVATTWIEVVALDASGAQASEPMRVSKEGSTVVSFDVAASADGALVVAYRDDDAPTGGGTRGPLHLVRVHPGGVEPDTLSLDDIPTDGVPTLLPGWLGLPTLAGPDLLAKLGKNGLPSETPLVEPSLGRGEPIAAWGDRLLLAEPSGKAMRLYLVTCGDRALPSPVPSAAPSADD